MADRIQDFLAYCSRTEFGKVDSTKYEEKFLHDMNEEVVSLCKSMPESTQSDALLFFMRYFQIPFGQGLDIFGNYYTPAWSVIWWLIHFGPQNGRVIQEDLQNAKSAHAMALLLHPLDDHLNDGQIPVTHLTLLLRTQCWMTMNAALNCLANRVDGGKIMVQRFINHYYSSVNGPDEILSLDDYCDHFRKQMATWLIVPVLMAKLKTKSDEFADAIQTAYGSFGIAWRLLDDINDILTDMMKGIHSCIYICLPEVIKSYWGKSPAEKEKIWSKDIFGYILESSIIERIRERICAELDSAASVADNYDMTGWANELRSLARPLRNGRDELWTLPQKKKTTPMS
jgi:hypothetical protein